MSGWTRSPPICGACSTRWEAGKAMLVCIDKITCARMLKLIGPKVEAKAAAAGSEAQAKLAAIADADADEAPVLHAQRDRLQGQATWMDETIIELIISEAQNEVADFKKLGL
jgi:type I restriction enzyme R subunit